MITSKQKSARRKNMAIARKSKKKATKKISISKAAKLLKAKGLTLGPGKYSMKTGKTSYTVTSRSGKSKSMTGSQIRAFINRS